MNIEFLSAYNFRSFDEVEFSPTPGTNIFFGNNGAGKTNLLEAIFTLCLGRSQRSARDAMLVRSSEGSRRAGGGADAGDVYRLEGRALTGEGNIRISCAYQKGGRKKILIDENPVRISRLFRIFSIISMAPDDVTLFSGSPQNRRRFLDLHLSQASASYLADLTDYNKALAQKNSFLKTGSNEFCPFDPLIIEIGCRLMSARFAFIKFLNNIAPAYYRRVAQDSRGLASDKFGMTYAPNVPYSAVERIRENFDKKLIENRAKERILETAIVGPHRDDIDFTIGSFPARGYGSQGELRSAAVAMMVGAADFLESRRNEKPIMLLDEIFAELDEHRRDNMARLFGNGRQIFLTTAVEPPPSLKKMAEIYHIDNGQIIGS